MAEKVQKVLIVGYPKSGNTWLTRLCAEILDCPVEGYWQSDHDEIATEGEGRESIYRCYKTHHTWDELQTLGEQADHVIYVCRDPRDVYLSGMHYFYDLDPLKPERKTLLSRLINRFYKELFGKSKMSEKMYAALVNGDSRVHSTTSVSWYDHLKPYVSDPDVLLIRYEDMLSNPSEECRRISQFLGLDRSDEQLEKAIEYQSFEASRSRYDSLNDVERRDFMRKGRSEQWRSQMDSSLKSAFAAELAEELGELNYPLK